MSDIIKLPTWEHSRLGASKAERWMNCPGSVRMSEGIPDKPTIYSATGTAGHEVAARVLASEDDADVWLGQKFQLAEFIVDIDEDMVDAIQAYVNYVCERRDLLDADLLIEQTFSLKVLDPPDDMFGTADTVLVIAGGRYLEIVDLKLGVGVVVDPEENAQLMYYALGALITLHHQLTERPLKIKATIVQPRAYHPDGAVRTFEFTYEQLVEFKNELFARAGKTQDPNAPLATGSWCRFCPAQAVCPAQRQHAVTLAQTEFDDLPAVDIPPPDKLTLDQVVQALEKGYIIEDWLRAVRLHAQTLLEAGEVVPGWKLVERRATRKWTDPDDTAEIARWALEQGIDSPFHDPKVKSPAQMETAIKKLLPRGQKNTAPAVLEESGLVSKVSSGNTIAPTKDARPELPSTRDEFESLPDSAVQTEER